MRVLALAPSSDERLVPRTFVDDVAAELRSLGADGRVRLDVGNPLVALADRRRIAQQHDGFVLVVQPGTVDATELREARAMLSAVGLHPPAVVVLPTGRTARSRKAEPEPATGPKPVSDEGAGVEGGRAPGLAVPALPGR